MATMMQDNPRIEPLRNICQAWLKAVQAAAKKRKPFDEVGNQCQQFFSGSVGFMWEKQFSQKHLSGRLPSTRYKITLAKAFELVAIFGPHLYHQNPRRTVKPRRKFEADLELFASSQGGFEGEMQQMLMQQMQQQEQMRDRTHAQQAALMESYLNYTPDEMPGEGLRSHAMMAITEALVKGRGVLWPQSYKHPGSDRTLTGCFFDHQKNLYADPDAETWDDAWWISKRECKPYWKVEQEFGLPRGVLKKAAKAESTDSRVTGSTYDDLYEHHKKNGETNDLIVIHRIWSKMGPGGRLKDKGNYYDKVDMTLDTLVGDYAYIVVADGIDWPLNAPRQVLEKASDDEVKARFQWPDPYHKDSRWPCKVLSFYQDPEKLYPIPPMAPGLGELMFMNIFVAKLADRTDNACKDVFAVAEDALEVVRKAWDGNDQVKFLPISNITKSVTDKIEKIKLDPVAPDAWTILDIMARNFERRTGLSELLYSMNPGGVQSRSATDAKIKEQASQVRPEFMAQQVSEWMKGLADMEKLLARWRVKGRDLVELVGPVGAFLWDQHIANAPMESIVREVRMEVAPETMRRPSKERDAQNINAVMNVLMPELSKHADATGDTGPVNELFRKWGNAVEMEMDGLEMGPRQPEVDEAAQQAQQQQMQLQMAKLQADVQKSEAAVQKSQVDIQKAMLDSQTAMAQSQATMEQQELEATFEMQRQETELQKSHQELDKGEIEIDKAELEVEGKELDLELKEKELRAPKPVNGGT